MRRKRRSCVVLGAFSTRRAEDGSAGVAERKGTLPSSSISTKALPERKGNDDDDERKKEVPMGTKRTGKDEKRVYCNLDRRQKRKSNPIKNTKR